MLTFLKTAPANIPQDEHGGRSCQLTQPFREDHSSFYRSQTNSPNLHLRWGRLTVGSNTTGSPMFQGSRTSHLVLGFPVCWKSGGVSGVLAAALPLTVCTGVAQYRIPTATCPTVQKLFPVSAISHPGGFPRERSARAPLRHSLSASEPHPTPSIVAENLVTSRWAAIPVVRLRRIA